MNEESIIKSFNEGQTVSQGTLVTSCEKLYKTKMTKIVQRLSLRKLANLNEAKL